MSTDYYWTVGKDDKNNAIVLLNGFDKGYGSVVNVKVPTDPDKEDDYVEFTFAKGENALLDLEMFESDKTDFSNLFFEKSFSSYDFVRCWKELESRDMPDDFGTSIDGEILASRIDEVQVLSMSEENQMSDCGQDEQDGKVEPKKKRKRRGKDSVSGRQRALLAWSRNIRNYSDSHGVRFGAEGWPPPFKFLVREMRKRIKLETGKEEDWNTDDIAMLRKYFYLKHDIPEVLICVKTVHYVLLVNKIL